MMNRIRLALLPLCTLAVSVACGGDSSGPPAVASVDVSTPSADLVVGQTTQLSATARDAKGNALSNRTITWSTSSASIATVTTNGLVTAVAVGQVSITATAEGKSGSRNVTVVPPPVATVVVTAASNALQVNQTTRVTAVTRDANNNVLEGRGVTFSTSNAAIATVTGDGLVTAVSAGTVTIAATSEGKTGSTDIVVTAANPTDGPQISSVTPATIVEGQTATISGTKFSPTVAGNVVRVGGVAASVTAATATSLQIVVPALNCRPPQNIAIDVTVAGATSPPKSHPFAPPSTFTLAQGKQQLLANPADFCLQFAATGATESYLIGVQSVSSSGASVTLAKVTAEVPAGASVSAPASRTFGTPSLTGSLSARVNSPLDDARAQRIAKHRAVESQFIERDRAFFQSRLASLGAGARAAAARSAAAATVPTVPGTAKVGDVLTVRVPDRNDRTCQLFTSITATVKSVGTNSVILEDNANPTGGFSTTDYETLTTQFDAQIYATDVAYFGTPTDFDANSRIAIVITKEVNKVTNLLGIVFFANFFTQANCAASNEGEFFYGRAPDPNGTAGTTYTVADALEDAPVIIAHEFTHVIQVGRRLSDPLADFQTVWELEGQATLGEEVNGYAATGLGPGQNLGVSVVFNEPQTTPSDWFLSAIGNLVVYYGFMSRTSKAPNAPEECSWLSLQSQGNDGPCLADYPVYGGGWAFLRWLSDQFGPTFPGGERGLHQKLVDNRLSGFATIANVVGVPIDVLLSQWAAALYTDDRVAGLDPRLRFTSWNFKEIESGVVTTARLTPRDRQFGAFSDQVSVRGGSTAYFLVSGTGRSATGIRVRDTADGPLPIVMRTWVVRLQ